MFKKVIGQDHSESRSPAPSHPEIRHAEPLPTPASYGSQAPIQAARTAPAANRNVLSSDVDIKGTVKFTNDLIVDGKIEGEIASDGNLTVGENARIKAEIKTATVIVYGKVHGNLTATDRVELKASAEVVGDIKAKTLSIEAGAIFVGKSTVGTPAQAPAQTPAAASPAPAQSATPSSSPAKAAPAATQELPKQGSLLTGTNP
ncbi:MAG: polymer-forming cytoskeletal protein [Luteolibacter sp.]|nr:polymer-forming cytoskeletal protein [Luteolibacter sp.]